MRGPVREESLDREREGAREQPEDAFEEPAKTAASQRLLARIFESFELLQ